MAANIIGIDNVVNYLREVGTKHWYLYTKGGKTPVFFYTKPSANTDDAIESFKKVTSFIQEGNPMPGEYLIRAYPKGVPAVVNNNRAEDEAAISVKNNMVEVIFSFTPSTNPYYTQPAPMQAHQPGIGALDIDTKIAEGIERYKLQQELEELREIKKEYEASSDGVEGVLAKIMGYIDAFKGNAAPAAIAGIEDEGKAEQIEKINRAIKVLYKHDNLIGDHLLKLADMAENNTTMFTMLIGNLNNL